MNHAHIVLAFALLGTTALAGTGCASSQDLGCFLDETCAGGEDLGPVVPPPPPGPKGMRTFITRATFDGNLVAAGGEKTGIDSANALCQATADGATLGGRWVAWISDSTSDAIDRVADDGPWSLVKEANIVYANRFAVGAPTSVEITDEHGAIERDSLSGVDEFGHGWYIDIPADFWTGALASGRSSGHDCSGWQWAFEYPTVGTTASYLGANATELGCDEVHHLLCLEQK